MAIKFEPIGQCIYCGKTEAETELKKEHIIPYSLAGLSFLPKASCSDCEAITSAFEGKCVRTMFKLLRLRFDIQSRRRKKRIKSMKVQAIVNGKDSIINMPINGLLGTVGYVHFPIPGFLRSPEEHPENFLGVQLSVKNFMPKDITEWRKRNVSNVGSELTFHVESYALTLAKIAHCYAIGTFGFYNFQSLLTNYIINQDTNGLAYLVGSLEEIEPPKTLEGHHQIEWDIIPKNATHHYILIRLRLFSYLGGPTAQIIVGLVDAFQITNILEYLKKHNHSYEFNPHSNS
mgnify:CR=1 FL=1